MFTINYKGAFIHGYVDKDECRVQVLGRIILCSSLQAAKRAISIAIRSRED